MAATGEEKLPRPPRRCTPEQFYTEYIPELWQALAGDIAWPGHRHDLGFVIEGAERLAFTVTFAGGVLSGRAGTSAEALAELHCDEPSWRLSAHDIFPRAVRRTNKRLAQVREELRRGAAHMVPELDPQALQALAGTIEIEFSDDAGDRGLYRVLIAGGAGPTARIEAGDEDLWALLECSGHFVSLLKSRAQLDGDVGYLFELARFFEGT